MRKYIIAGNWKMNLNLEQGYGLVTEISGMMQDEIHSNVELVVIPPFIHLHGVQTLLKDSPVKTGAQNCHHKTGGAYTGEISPTMLADMKIDYVIIGHSERRQYFGETNALLAEKINAALDAGLTPIYCFGETLEEREAGQELNVNFQQVKEGLFHLSEEQFSKMVLAYEPVWAIGTGKTATSEQAQEIHSFIRSKISEKYGNALAEEISILYGGSMKPGNASELLSCKDIDGGLIGGAALESRSFIDIAKAVV
ncbi:MAG: triose-phosphate isomerase [Flavobacteriales bacterium]|nr:triose-phosphate isomerase [Flavobacteriales bacterium]